MGLHPVNRGTRGDGRNVAAVLDCAFRLDPVSRWLLNNPAEMARRHMRFLLVQVEYVLQRSEEWQDDARQGEVHLSYDEQGYAGAALWLNLDPARPAPGPDMDRIADALGGDAFDRFLVLDRWMHRHHPVDVAHAYLPFIGVVPERQGQGIGGHVLETKLAELDETGTPAYLEASNPRSCSLYRRLGFRPLGDPFWLPDEGPPLFPMWREPKRPRQPANDGRWSGWPL